MCIMVVKPSAAGGVSGELEGGRRDQITMLAGRQKQKSLKMLLAGNLWVENECVSKEN